MNKQNNKNSNLTNEYIAAQQAFLHYDGFAWQIGGVLLTGVFVFWGFLASSNERGAGLYFVSSILVFSILACWILYAYHHRCTYLFKLHRIWELENILGFKQHVRFNTNSSSKPVYNRLGPRGHNINLWIFSIVSAGTPLIGLCKANTCILLKLVIFTIIPSILIIAILRFVIGKERQITENIDLLSKKIRFPSSLDD